MGINSPKKLFKPTRSSLSIYFVNYYSISNLKGRWKDGSVVTS